MSLSPPLQMAITPRPRQDFALDNNDAIIKRLNDIVLSIAGDTRSSLDSNTIAAINSELDNIELLLGREEKRTEFDDRAESDLESQTSTNVGDDGLHAPLTLIQEPQISIKPSLQVFSPPPRPAASITASWAMDISKVADELTSKLITSVQELQKRREESEHIRGLLVARAEKAAERIVYLESEISEMEDDFEASQSELRYLRIQLQALEAQCSQYMPYEEDKELSQSIMNWKVDWEDIDRRSKARRLKRSALLANVHASRTDL